MVPSWGCCQSEDLARENGATSMGRRPRRTHSTAFKVKVMLAAVRGDKTPAELAQSHDLLDSCIEAITVWR